MLKMKPKILNMYFKTLHNLVFTFLSQHYFPHSKHACLLLVLLQNHVLSSLVNFDQGIFFAQNALLPHNILNSLNA